MTVGKKVVAFIGMSSVVAAAFVLYIEVASPRFRDIQMGMVLVINVGVLALVLLALHLILSVVPRWRHRTTLWVMLAWFVMILGFFLEKGSI